MIRARVVQDMTTPVRVASDESRRVGMPFASPGQDGEGFELGAVRTIPHATIPYGWMACDGSEVARSAYADLFALIGERWGSGDATTTFNLPYYPTKLHVVPATAGREVPTAVTVTIIKVLP